MTKQTQEALNIAAKALKNIKDSLDERQIWYSMELEHAYQTCKKTLEQSKDFVPHEKADAWLVPYLLDIHGARRTSLPEHLHDTFHGTVAWSAEIFTDTNYIEDKYGVKHYPKALYTKSHEWNSLTDDEINKISDDKDLYSYGYEGIDEIPFARAIEQLLKDKNL